MSFWVDPRRLVWVESLSRKCLERGWRAEVVERASYFGRSGVNRNVRRAQQAVNFFQIAF